MDSNLSILLDVLRHFGFAQDELVGIKFERCQGGFSNSMVWKVSVQTETYSLRAWNRESMTESKLSRLHRFIEFAHQRTNGIVPAIRKTVAGSTFVATGNLIWEVLTWIPGEATFSRNPTEEKLRAGLHALAKVHCAWREFANPFPAPPPAVLKRLELLNSWKQQKGFALAAELAKPAKGELREIAAIGGEFLKAFWCYESQIRLELQIAAQFQVKIQPCLRDIWHDHLLFDGERVSGIIDFGAVDWDTIATDLARLLPSLVGDDKAKWEIGLQAYAEVAELTPVERDLVSICDRSASLLSGLNWMQWIFLEDREFADWNAVYARLQTFRDRLAHFASPIVE